MAIELPKDAKGREIPLDTRRLCDEDGERKTVFWFVYSPTLKRWMVILDEGPDGMTSAMAVSHFHLIQPDSWEKLEEDLRRTTGASDAICAYFGGDNRDCVACRLNKEFFKAIPYCNPCLAFKDILNRIRKLRGEDNA